MTRERVRSKAPLRLGLAGGGTDVSPYSELYGGAVLNATIDMSTYTTIDLSDDGSIVLEALERDEVCEFELSPVLPVDGKLSLHKGVYNRVIRDFCNSEPIPVRVTTHSDAPAGSGLGTSSTLVVAMVNAYKDLLNLPLGEYEIASLAFDIERQ